MPLTVAERAKRYREKKKNDKVFRLKERERHKRRRQNMTPLQLSFRRQLIKESVRKYRKRKKNGSVIRVTEPSESQSMSLNAGPSTSKFFQIKMEIIEEKGSIFDTRACEDENELRGERIYNNNAVDDLKVNSSEISLSNVTSEKSTTDDVILLEDKSHKTSDSNSNELESVKGITQNVDNVVIIDKDPLSECNENSTGANTQSVVNLECVTVDSVVNVTEGPVTSDKSDDAIVTSKEDVILISDDDSECADSDEVKDPNEEPLVNYSDLVPEPHCSKCSKKYEGESCNCECHMRCGVCLKLFNNKQHLKIHSLLHYGRQKFMLKENITQPKKKPGPPKKKTTVVQPKKKQASNRVSIQKSRLNSSNENLYVCTLCESAFVRQSSYLCHKKIHDIDKLYRCEMCDESFKKKSDFTQHMLVFHYVKEKYNLKHVVKEKILVYDCDWCEKRFRLLSDLRKHTKSLHHKPLRKCKSKPRKRNKKNYLNNMLYTPSYTVDSKEYYHVDDVDIVENKVCLDDISLENKPYSEVLDLLNKEISSENTDSVGNHFMSNSIYSENCVFVKEEGNLEEFSVEKKSVTDSSIISNDCCLVVQEVKDQGSIKNDNEKTKSEDPLS